jgi:hypothetical protein
MKTALLAALLLAATPALAYKTLAGNPNYGKADDYGSETFAMVNQCMITATQQKNLTLSDCMKDNGYAFLPNARVFGNSGPKCKTDEMGVWHSWCWGKLGAR